MKKTLWILAAGVALLVILMITRERSQARAIAPGFVFDTAQVASVERLHVTLGEDSVVVVRRREGRWVLLPDSIPADAKRIDRALRHLLRLQDKEVVSRGGDTARLAEFGLQPGERKRISWSRGDRTETIDLGHTSGIDFNSTYWKHPDGNEVYRTPGNFTHEISIHPHDWMDQAHPPTFDATDSLKPETTIPSSGTRDEGAARDVGAAGNMVVRLGNRA